MSNKKKVKGTLIGIKTFRLNKITIITQKKH